jgi:hypothetical protein
MCLHVVEDRVDKHADVRVFIRKQLEYNRDHLSVVQHKLSRWPEEHQFEKSIQNLLHHFIVFLFGAKHILKEFDQIAVRNLLGSLVVSAQSTDKHHAFEHDVVFCISVHQLVLQKLKDTFTLHHLVPPVCRHVDHGAEKLKKQVGIFPALDCQLDVDLHVVFKSVDRLRVELCDVSANFKQQGILEFECALNQSLVLLFLR